MEIVDGIKGDGNGFKVGGVDNKTPGEAAHADPLNHVLIDCTASGNTGAGFDRNNQTGVVTMKGCTGTNNALGNYKFPAKGTPSALGKKITIWYSYNRLLVHLQVEEKMIFQELK